jgi:D-alanyl-D-alanine carboxypeptidase
MVKTAKLAGALALAAAVGVPVALSGLRPAHPAARPPAVLDVVAPPPDVPSGTGDTSRLTPALKRSVRRATAAAAADGVELRVTSGWRSRQHQADLFAAAVRKYGSTARARRWVLPPDESAHVRGQAVDIGPEAGAAWLRRNGARFGLCQRYANEPWHFERLAGKKGSKCPAPEPHP